MKPKGHRAINKKKKWENRWSMRARARTKQTTRRKIKASYAASSTRWNFNARTAAAAVAATQDVDIHAAMTDFCFARVALQERARFTIIIPQRAYFSICSIFFFTENFFDECCLSECRIHCCYTRDMNFVSTKIKAIQLSVVIIFITMRNISRRNSRARVFLCF